jgi:hypothetical protein
MPRLAHICSHPKPAVALYVLRQVGQEEEGCLVICVLICFLSNLLLSQVGQEEEEGVRQHCGRWGQARRLAHIC